MKVELMTDADHPVYGNGAIREELNLLVADRFSRRVLERYVDRLANGVFRDREPEAVAPLAQKLLAEALRLDEVRVDAVQRILKVIQERGLWVEPLPDSGGRVDGVEPAETFEEFLRRNRIEDQLERKLQLQAHGANQHTAPSGLDNYQVQHRGGTGSSYLEARLRRDAPDHAQALERGDYRSVRAAAIAAGIITPTAQLVLTKDPVTSACRVLEQRDPDWVSEFCSSLMPRMVDPCAPAAHLRDALIETLGERLPYILSSILRRQPGLYQLVQLELADEPAEPAPAVQPGPVEPAADMDLPARLNSQEAAQRFGFSVNSVHRALSRAQHDEQILPSLKTRGLIAVADKSRRPSCVVVRRLP
jgi:hypothetical protein